MFTVQTERQAVIWKNLLDLYYPDRSAANPLTIIDFSFGSGGIWWDVFEKTCACCHTAHVKLTKTDAAPPLEKWEEEIANRKARIAEVEAGPAEEAKLILPAMRKDLEIVLKKKPPDDDVVKMNLLTSNYAKLGKFTAGVFDPPCLIGKRTAFDYKHKDGFRMSSSHIVSTALQGPRSWGATQLEKFTNNPTIADFDARLKGVNRQAAKVLEDGGRLFVKIFEPRENGRVLKLCDHTRKYLTNFESEDEIIYLRQGATTFKIAGHPQNLHGFWLTFTKR